MLLQKSFLHFIISPYRCIVMHFLPRSMELTILFFSENSQSEGVDVGREIAFPPSAPILNRKSMCFPRLACTVNWAVFEITISKTGIYSVADRGSEKGGGVLM